MTIYNTANLPSRTIPYGFKELEMKPFLVPQIMQMSKAISLQSLQPMVLALCEVVNIDGLSLTDGDFYYLLAVQRLCSYVESPLQASWTCAGTVFKESGGLERTFTQKQLADMVEGWDSADEEERKDLTDPSNMDVTTATCNHENVSDIQLKDLEILYLEKGTIPDGLDYPRINTLAEAFKLREDPNVSGILEAARWVIAGDTLKDKIEILKEQPDLALFEQALQCSLTVRHGMGSVIKKHCEFCSAESSHLFDITPETFFSV